MPRDYNLSPNAVSGLKSARPGGIAGRPARLGQGGLHWKFKNTSAPGDGVLRGSPVGISGEIRRMTSAGLMSAISKRLR